ncbi:MAG: dTDP-4-amino-4,6-dideoxygalactose transaminase [Candidatus Symbiodolus clandestinus]
MADPFISFNKPYLTGKELEYITQALVSGHLAGDGPFAKACQVWLEHHTGTHRVLLTPSCTAALEMSALLLDIQAGDEVIMPAFTFVSTANAFVLRGGVPVWVDIRPDTLNINETLIEVAITSRTRAIVPVHYAGVACEMDTILAIARRHRLAVIEDAAQGVMAYYKGRALGSIGNLGTYSFHGSKNITCGEGGALLVNDPQWIKSSEIMREKGTDRSSFLRGEVDKYTWQSIGSSFLPNEITAAFLLAQLQGAERVTQERLARWRYYHEQLASLETQGILQRPTIPQECQHNAHFYYVLLDPKIDRPRLLKHFKKNNITVSSHYIPLDCSPGGKKYGHVHGQLTITHQVNQQLLRLPLWVEMRELQQEHVLSVLSEVIR